MVDLSGRRVLVTGAGGFVGGHLCRLLQTQRAHVVGFFRKPTAIQQELAEQYVVDILNRDRVRQLLKEVRPDFVVHLAAAKNRTLDMAEYRTGFETNLFGTLNIVEACQELSTLSRFVFLGTCEEYGQQDAPFKESSREIPITAYAVTKLSVTHLLQTLARAKNFPTVILRPSIVYGPGQNTDMFLPALIKALISGKRFGMSPGKQTRDFLYVTDLLDAILKSLVVPSALGRIINVSSALPVRIEELALKVAMLIGPEAVELIDFGAQDCRPGEAMNYRVENSLAKFFLEWMPRVSLEEGLRLTIDHYRSVTQFR